MTDRTTLALTACAGISDAELAERGTQGYAKMIQRKRKYAQAARMMAVANAHLAKELAKAQAALKAAQTQLTTLEQLDAPVGDTTLAAGMLAHIAAKPAPAAKAAPTHKPQERQKAPCKSNPLRTVKLDAPETQIQLDLPAPEPVFGAFSDGSLSIEHGDTFLRLGEKQAKALQAFMCKAWSRG